MKNKQLKIDPSWTLFLDRDGVINKKRVNDYVKSIDELEILEGALEAIASFSDLFGEIFIVTNQRGIARGLMTNQDVEEVHAYLLNEIQKFGGRITQVYFCPDDNGSSNRKPAPGMGLLAKENYPQIDFSKSIMVGDSKSDMEFGRAIGAFNYYLNEQEIADELIDGRIQSLQGLLSIID